jgi:hypothetical protein
MEGLGKKQRRPYPFGKSNGIPVDTAFSFIVAVSIAEDGCSHRDPRRSSAPVRLFGALASVFWARICAAWLPQQTPGIVNIITPQARAGAGHAGLARQVAWAFTLMSPLTRVKARFFCPWPRSTGRHPLAEFKTILRILIRHLPLCHPGTMML